MNRYLRYILIFVLVLSLIMNIVLYNKYNNKKESYTHLKIMYNELFDSIISK
ncbi:hypothetical protein SAMN04487895_101600 [Paenibacillus sophorae]|uniref:Uncharacterized protein n=1 Tax=Paenibacillus sophorae TaxID=1333845 RepID=A0A1H8GPR3_9BACL|nr:hypothetical protein SAMN04487895_101600 [Paenibacillus sophorae]